jgi:hypothetical protein
MGVNSKSGSTSLYFNRDSFLILFFNVSEKLTGKVAGSELAVDCVISTKKVLALSGIEMPLNE